MNTNQLAQQLKYKLQNVTWDDGTKVFGSCVYVTDGPPSSDVHPQFPFALVFPEASTNDEDLPGLREQTFRIVVAALVLGDPLGEFAMIGGPQADNRGRGVGELEERAHSAVSDLVGFDGAPIMVSESGYAGPQVIGDNQHAAFVQLTVTAVCTGAAYYSEPQKLVSLGGDGWSWDGSRCSSRFDFLQYRLGYGGESIPATPEDCSEIIYTGTDATTIAAAVGNGYYAVFADYNTRGATAVEGSSRGDIIGAYLQV